MRLIRSVLVLALAAGLVSAAALQSGPDPSLNPPAQGLPSGVDPNKIPDLPEVAPEDVKPETKAVAGSYAQAMQAVHEAVRAEETGEALAMARGLLEETWLDGLRSRVERLSPGLARQTLGRLRAPLGWLGLRSLSGEQRGEVHYTIGTLMLVEGEALAAGGSFELAAYEGGPGEVRLDSLYGLGWIDLVTGEALRQQIPEIAGQQGAPPAAAPPGGGAGGDEEPPDYLNLARASYRAAKAHFVERLRLDSSDADTRANVELILRRLRELDEIERQREEQEQESDDQQESDEDSQSQQEQDDSEEDEEESEQEEQDESEDEQEEPSEDQQEPQEQEGETDEEQEEQSFQRDVPEEKFMTKEEMKRLLDRLHEIDEKGEALRERLRGRQRVPVKKDW